MQYMRTRDFERRRNWLQTFAEKRDCVFVEQGEVGFGRPCVGIKYGQSYVDLPLYDMPGFPEQWNALPPAPMDAYHKHDCLAVLVHNEEYDEAIQQLYMWCYGLKAAKFEVKVRSRQTFNTPGTFGSALELMMGGADQAYLWRD